MADTNQSRRDGFAEFSDNDPFAELTRIMGHDPRASAPVPQPAGDSFDIDLEKELLGELDFTDFDEPQPEAEPEYEPAPEAAAYEAQGQAGEPAFEAEDDLELEAVFDEAAEAPIEEERQAEPYDLAAPEPEPVVAFEDDLDDTLEREMLAQEPSYDAPPAEDDLAPMDELIAASEEPQPQLQAVEEAAAVPAFDVDEGMAEVDMDFGFLEEELATAAEPAPEETEAAAEPEAFAPVFFAPVDEPAEPPVAETLSLEDELTALLGETPSPAAADHWLEPAAPEPADDWQPSVSTFGRTNFAAAQPEEPEAEPAAAEVHAAPVEMLGEDDFADIFREEPEPEAAYSAAGEPAPEEQQPVESGVDALAAWQPERAWNEPAQAPAQAAEAVPDIETVEVSEAAFAMTDDLDIPDVDYGAAEQPSGLYDDLEGEIAQAFGDVAADEPETFAAQPAPGWGAAAAAAGVAAYGAPAAAPSAAAAQGDHHEAQPPADAYALGEGQWQADGQLSDDGFDYETDLEQAIAMSSYEEAAPERPASRNRGLLIAAVVAGVAVVGGVGVFGMSLFGGGSDAPAFVLADSDPMKVRPENPGGATVPNQDNEVYQRVAGGASDAAPEQERLITTAEEPVDVTAAQAGEAAVLAPGISSEAGEPFAVEAEGEDAVAAAPKVEDRIGQPAEAEGVGASGDVAAVAPRRVRTMVVRADGTMVPREEVEPVSAAESAIAAAPIAAVPSLAPANQTLPGLAAPGEAAVAEEEDAGPVVETPATVSVVPSQRTEPQQQAAAPAPVAPVAQSAVQQAPQVPAATPVSAPAAAAPAAASGAWSMQIASQPTAEGAQTTYQDLARRYGGVLEGRGVNIVRADIEGMGTYYRVRIPASTRDEAIQLCTRYKAAGGSCFVSR